jgi:hypothetical protein
MRLAARLLWSRVDNEGPARSRFRVHNNRLRDRGPAVFQVDEIRRPGSRDPYRMKATLLSALMALLLLSPEFAGASHGPGSITVLATDPLTPSTLYAGTLDRGVLKSSDGTATWNATGLANSSVRALSVDPATPNILYGGTDQGVVKSSDGGTTWMATGLTGMAQTLIIHPVTTTTLYVVLAGSGAFKSDNGGADWTAFGPAETVVRALTLDHSTPTTLYAGGDGIYRSVNGGTSWDPIGLAGHAVSALGSYGGAVYAVSQYGVFKSASGGAWTPTERMPSVTDLQTPTTLYTGTISGMFKSVDDGANWMAVNTGLTDVLLAQGASTEVGSLAIDAVTMTLYAATELGVFTSLDGAATWQHSIPEDCFNWVDDDGDGLVDSQDPDCPLTCLQGEPCPPDYICNPNGFCEPHCHNGFADGDESGVDCGGNSCAARCENGQSCYLPSDCVSGICSNGVICAAAVSLAAVSVDPATVVGGNPASGAVRLDTAAPSGGQLVTLSVSNTSAVTVPGTVTVTAGAPTAPFNVTTSPVTSSTTVTIFATAGGVTRSAQMTVTPAATVAGLTLNPTSVQGGATSTGTVSLTAPAPAAGAIVTLASGNTAAATVPGSVTVPAGTTTATFTVATGQVAVSTTAAISASAGGVNRTAQLTITPTPMLSALGLNPTSVRGGRAATGTVVLSASAPTGGVVVALSSSKPAVATVPGTVTVPAGATSASFPISTSKVKSSTAVTISAELGGVNRSATLTITR